MNGIIKTVALWIVVCINNFLFGGFYVKKNPIELPITVVICSYNNGQWSEATLKSIFTQDYTNFRVIIVDDCSTDNNCEVIQKCIDEYNMNDRVIFIRNTARHRKLFNLYKVLYECDDDSIVFMLDGDDYVSHPRVFSFINDIYRDENIWFTYGQYRNVPASQAIQWGHKEMGYCRPVPKHVQRKQAYRYYSFIYMHPRTFRGWLFKLVKLEDLIADKILAYEGDFYPASNDVAMYFPMVEMAHTHIRFIPDILYIRNLFSEIVGFKVDRRLQTTSSREIRKKACYTALFQPKKNRLEAYRNAQSSLFLLCRYDLNNIEEMISNIQQHSVGLDTMYLFFHNTQENKKVCRFIKDQFPNVVFVPYDKEGSKSLKNRLLDCLTTCKNEHICIATDNCSFIDTIDFPHYIFWLEKTYAHRFYLNRHSLLKGVPKSIQLSDDICTWKNPMGADKWKGIVLGEDVFLCRKVNLYQEIKNLNFTNTYTLLKEMHLSLVLPARVELFLKNEHIKPIV
ncbi:MAG TPA: glycosyltransferase family 2 protein [Candidatus Babeliales bacterium]|nr:glycosyltransferase family 2 protein [Candidatus Babeliales bacterium]